MSNRLAAQQARADAIRRAEIRAARREIEKADTLSWLRQAPDLLHKLADDPVRAAVITASLRRLLDDPETPRPDRAFIEKMIVDLDTIMLAVSD